MSGAGPASLARRIDRLKTARIAMSLMALLGMLLAVVGTLAQIRTFGVGSGVTLAGVALLAIGSMLNLMLFWRIKPVHEPGVIGHSGIDFAEAESRVDAHWQMADRAATYHQLVDAQQDFITRRSGDGHLTFANATFCDAFEVRREEIIGSLFQPPVVRSEPVTRSGPSRRRIELLRTRKGKRWISWDETNVTDERGERQIQSVGRDVTSERTTEDRLKEARDQAQSASHAKSRFLAAMSHEIRTPMNGILGMISLMRDTPLNDEQRTCASAVEVSARALLNLVDNILDLSKIEAGKLEISKRRFSLRSCIAQATQLVAPEAAAKHLTLVSTVADDVPDRLSGDETRVRQIVLNLLTNAVKFTDTGGVKVHVSVARRQAVPAGAIKLAIEVEDTGIGFPPDVMTRLFREFEQGEVATGREPGGTGLGLAISRHLARAMGGDIVARGAPYEGATFTAILRFEIADAATEVADAPARPGSRSGIMRAKDKGERRSFVGMPFNVLVAEDNQVSAL
jgi:signal transduction histidine kinase